MSPLKIKGENMNKKLLLLTAAPLVLTSCGYKMSKEKALALADDFAPITEVRKATVKTIMDVSKAEGVFEKLYKDKEETESSVPVVPLTKGELSALIEEDFNISSLLGKIYCTLSYDTDDIKKEYELPESTKINGSVKATATYTTDGYILKSTSKMNFSFEYSLSGITVKGAIKASTKTTYTY